MPAAVHANDGVIASGVAGMHHALLMLIQDEVPLPVDPLATLEADYRLATVHIAWTLRKKVEEPRRTLLFAWVELLPTEVPPPEDDGDIEGKLGANNAHRLYVRHAVVPAERALRWYLDCRRGTATLPEPDGRLPEVDEPGVRKIQLGELEEEPPWPGLVCVNDRSVWVPFCPAWHKTPRVHHLVRLTDLDLKSIWPRQHERDDAIAFLGEHLHFDLSAHEEYLGSVHMVAPNPVFRGLDVRREPRGGGGREHIMFRFRPRAAQGVGMLQISAREDRPSGVGALHCVSVRQSVVRMSFDHKTDTHSETVTDPARGVLYVSKNGIFIDAVKLGVSVGPSVKRVVRAADGSSYEVQLELPASEHVSTLRNSGSSHGRAHVPTANLRRRRRAQAGDQYWFSGTREEAKGVLREILFGAKREVLIVDPYFGSTEMMDFVLAVRATAAVVCVLTSAEVLKTEIAPAVDGGDALLAELKRVSSQPYANKTEIRVMPGGRPAVHDRFFVVDERVWLLGSSLNEFGSRGTMMVALPNPAPVREKLFDAWRDAKGLESWLRGHKARKREADAREVAYEG